MEEGFLILKDGEIVGKEEDFGNAAELHMVMCEMHPVNSLNTGEWRWLDDINIEIILERE